MDRLTFAGIERKTHPNYMYYLAGVYDDREMADPYDVELIPEIIDLYQRYSEQLVSAGGEWTWIQENRQKEYRELLAAGDKDALIPMFRNFFLNENSFGISAPDEEADSARKQLVNNILLDVDTWNELCGNLPVQELNAPRIGNPFGIMLEDSLIMYNSCRHYYHASRLKTLCQGKTRPTIFEIGGGYGGVF